MTAKFALTLLLAAASMVSAAAETAFFAVSAAPDDAGGVYRVEGGKARRIAGVPNLFHLVRDRESGKFYGVARRGFGAKKRFGAVVVLEAKRDGTLETVRTLPIQARTPCFVALAPDRKHLYTANYSSGDLCEIPLEDGKPAGEARLIRHTGHGVTPRQKSPHPHCALFDPAGKCLYVCDLGTDRIHVYDRTPERGLTVPAAEELQLPPGSGPRHLVFAPDGNILYVANELNGTAASFVRDEKSGKWRLKAMTPTLARPAAVPNYPGAVKLSADGRTLYVTNRGDNSVARFDATPDGGLTLRDTIPAGGDYPSDLMISAEGKILAVANFKSGNVTTPEGTIEVKQPIALCP